MNLREYGGPIALLAGLLTTLWYWHNTRREPARDELVVWRHYMRHASGANTLGIGAWYAKLYRLRLISLETAIERMTTALKRAGAP